MEPRDVVPPVDLAPEEREPIARPGSDHRAALARRGHGREVPLHDPARALSPGGARPDAVHPSRSAHAIRSPGARPLDEKEVQVWLW